MKIFLYLTLPLFILDQITKEWVVRHFSAGTSYETGYFIEVIPGFFNLVRVHNTGMAFGIGNGSGYSNILFLFIAALAVTFITVLWRKGAFPSLMSQAAVALLLSGIAGNVFDRIFRGYVVDFLDFNLGFYRWPSFNVADACICVAEGILIIASFKEENESEEVAKAKSSS
ncbi:MAG: signal peptidase II [Verrucomicrobiota bacterium]